MLTGITYQVAGGVMSSVLSNVGVLHRELGSIRTRLKLLGGRIYSLELSRLTRHDSVSGATPVFVLLGHAFTHLAVLRVCPSDQSPLSTGPVPDVPTLKPWHSRILEAYNRQV
jgi:hypothetical protein